MPKRNKAPHSKLWGITRRGTAPPQVTDEAAFIPPVLPWKERVFSEDFYKEDKLATDNTKNTFDQIAQSWYNFRHWSIFRKELEMLAQRWQTGRLLNIGCAHGPDFLPFIQSFELHGMDFSSEMLKLAQRYARKFHFAVNLSLADISHLPYPDQTFDRAMSVATYHHIRYPEERQKVFYELWRVLKPGGEAFITVWNHWQPRFWFKSREAAVPWRTRDKTLYRYYYLFSYPELEKLAKQAGFEVLRSFPESSYRLPIKLFSRNICLLVRKINISASSPIYDHIDTSLQQE